MKYTLEAKPTFYNGIHFRSKLEAQWAAFFDLTGIKYEYEPENFNDWQPDFLIHGIKPIYVEVKPYITKDIIERYKKKCEEVIKSGTCEGPYIETIEIFGKYYQEERYDVELDCNVILVSNPLGHEKDRLNEGYEEIPFGVVFDYYGKEVRYSSLYWKDNFDFASQLIIWDGLIGTSKERKYFGYSNVNQKWNEAKNIIQTQII